MGTNYYFRGGRHLAKTSSQGAGKPFRVYWAADPADVAEDAHDHPNELVTDEYGQAMSLATFYAMVTTHGEYDGSLIGQEFS